MQTKKQIDGYKKYLDSLPMLTKICPMCKEQFNTKYDTKLTCSAKCREQRKGNSFSLLRESVGACEACGYSIAGALHAHHINNATRDNSLDNIIILCANCHYLYHRATGFNSKHKIMTREKVLHILEEQGV